MKSEVNGYKGSSHHSHIVLYLYPGAQILWGPHVNNSSQSY